MKATRTCSVDGCEKPVTRYAARGWCGMHYQRWAKTGQLNATKPRYAPDCQLPDCNDPHWRHGFCNLHFQRWRKHGDPYFVGRGGNYLGADAGYHAVHQRIRTRRGSASDYPCQHCVLPAAHWAYDHTDPNERQSDIGAFSLDLERYMPLCVPCHKRFDLSRTEVSR